MGTMRWLEEHVTVEFEVGDTKYKIIYTIDNEVIGTSVSIIIGVIFYMMPYAYLPTSSTNMKAYCDHIIENIDIIMPVLKKMVNKECYRHPVLDDVLPSCSMTKSARK